MEYPIFYVPLLGGSLLIAKMSIFHAFIAHFSVGSGFFLALAQRRAIAEGDEDSLRFLRKFSYMVLLVPYVLGTVTGVGIWFTVALVSPRVISLLIHQFVWDWATEWVCFAIEVVAIYLYFYGWGKVRPKTHNRIIWVFAITSLVTLIIINAILSFMLTPGGWTPHGHLAVWKGIFNPSYFPTTLMRILLSFALAGVGALVLIPFVKGVNDRVRERMVPLAYKMILPVVLCVPLLGWVSLVMPKRAMHFLMGGAPVMLIFMAFGMTALLFLTFGAGLSLARKDFRPSTLGVTLLCLFAFMAYGAFEFVREGIRKPYVIDEYMYSTGVTKGMNGLDTRADIERTRRDGVLAAAPWALPPGCAAADLDQAQLGGAVYNAACLRCHSVVGYNAMTPLVAGWETEQIRRFLDEMHRVKASMPPFPGTDAEKDALTAFLATLNPPLEGPVQGSVDTDGAPVAAH